jgi:hypothetical protein
MPDAYENLREPSEVALARFSDGEGYQPYTHRAFLRFRSLGYYFFHFARIGHAGAAEKTCERFGHEVRALKCERCGRPADPRR